MAQPEVEPEVEPEFQEADKPHHIQISDTFTTYLLIPALLLLAVLGYAIYRMITLPARKEWERKEKKRLKEEKKMKKK